MPEIEATAAPAGQWAAAAVVAALAATIAALGWVWR
jgi:hypothetical protein